MEQINKAEHAYKQACLEIGDLNVAIMRMNQKLEELKVRANSALEEHRTLIEAKAAEDAKNAPEAQPAPLDIA